jgi:hypothetical protein
MASAASLPTFVAASSLFAAAELFVSEGANWLACVSKSPAVLFKCRSCDCISILK